MPEGSDEVREQEEDGLEDDSKTRPHLLPLYDILVVLDPHFEAARNPNGRARVGDQLEREQVSSW